MMPNYWLCFFNEHRSLLRMFLLEVWVWVLASEKVLAVVQFQLVAPKLVLHSEHGESKVKGHNVHQQLNFLILDSSHQEMFQSRLTALNPQGYQRQQS
jgi:hypothetical protein